MKHAIQMFEGMKVALSGTFSVPQWKLTEMLELHGAQVSTTVTNKVTHLISTSEDFEKNSSKIKKAKENDIPIIPENFVHESISALKRVEYQVFGGNSKKVEEKKVSKKRQVAEKEAEEDVQEEEKPTKKRKTATKADKKETESKNSKAATTTKSTKANTIDDVDFSKLKKTVIPSAEFVKTWNAKVNADSDDKITDKGAVSVINTNIDESRAEATIKSKNLKFEGASDKPVHRAKLIGDIWAIRDDVTFNTWIDNPDTDDYGYWKRSGHLRLTVVNLQEPSKFVHVFVKESFTMTENIPEFLPTCLLEILLADVSKGEKNWVSWVISPTNSGWQTSSKAKESSVFPFLYYNFEERDGKNGSYAFDVKSKAFYEAAQFLHLKDVNFYEILEHAQLSLVHPELVAKKDKKKIIDFQRAAFAGSVPKMEGPKISTSTKAAVTAPNIMKLKEKGTVTKDDLQNGYSAGELSAFCKQNFITASGGKTVLIKRILEFLETGKAPVAKPKKKKKNTDGAYNPNPARSAYWRAFYDSM